MEIIGYIFVIGIIGFMIYSVYEGYEGKKHGYGDQEVDDGHVAFTHTYNSQFWTFLFLLICLFIILIFFN